jgi:hypothetical protein
MLYEIRACREDSGRLPQHVSVMRPYSSGKYIYNTRMEIVAKLTTDPDLKTKDILDVHVHPNIIFSLLSAF